MTPRQFQTFSVQRKNKIKVDRRISQKSNASSAVRRAKNGSIHSFLHIPGRKTIHLARLVITHLARSPIFPLPPSINKSKIFLSLPYSVRMKSRESESWRVGISLGEESKYDCSWNLLLRSRESRVEESKYLLAENPSTLSAENSIYGVGSRESGVESWKQESRVEKAKSWLKESSLRLFAHL